MSAKEYILVSIITAVGSVTHTSKDSVEDCLKVGRRYIRNRRARPIAIVNRKGEVFFSQKSIYEWAQENS